MGYLMSKEDGHVLEPARPCAQVVYEFLLRFIDFGTPSNSCRGMESVALGTECREDEIPWYLYRL
jgi:hypothetical protein